MGNYNANPNPDEARIQTVAFDYKFANQTDLKVDQFSAGRGKKVYSLVKKIGSTRLHVLVIPAEVPG